MKPNVYTFFQTIVQNVITYLASQKRIPSPSQVHFADAIVKTMQIVNGGACDRMELFVVGLFARTT